MAKLNQKWHNMNWKKISKYVKNLQKELVVAYKNNDQKLLFFLQEKLIMSFEGRAFAVRQIVINDGKNTPGLDKIVWNSPSAKFQAIQQLREILVQKSGKYQAGPIRRIWIYKDQSDELRPLGIPNIIDRGLQALTLLCLDPVVEEMSDTHSYGFRKYRSTSNAIQRIRTLLDKKSGPRYIWNVDIEKCFDKISHEFLEKEIESMLCPKAYEYFLKWLKAPIIEKGSKTFPREGIPQGAIISPLLCNIALNGLENAVRDGLPSPNSTEGQRISGSWVIRYADDFIVTCSCEERLIKEHIPRVISFLSKRGLNFSEKKSKIFNLENEGFLFLGWDISLKKRDPKRNQFKFNGGKVLIIKPSKKSIKSFKSKIKEKFRLNKPIRALISDLNPVLRGWANYYRNSYHSQEVFQSIGHYIYQLWWKWARKKHPQKNKGWIYNRYIFKTIKRSWRIGESKDILLFDITQAKQIKTKNLRSNVNPYLDEDYYIGRIIHNVERFRGAIYRKHNFKCYACEQALYGPEEVHLHHMLSRKDGGLYTLENIVPVHATCHENITYARKD
jgi:RNA-directed DNA polymerase